MRRWGFCIALVVFLLVLAVFLVAPVWLLIPLNEAGTIPSGTILTWMGMVALPTVLLLGSSRLYRAAIPFDRFFQRLLLGGLIFSLLWGLVGFGLAGNWNYTFSGSVPAFRGSSRAAVYFWIYTYGVPISIFSIWGLYWLLRLVNRWLKLK